MLKYEYILQIKYAEAILSNSTRKLLRLETTKLLRQFKKQIYSVIYYNFRHTFVPYIHAQRQSSGSLLSALAPRTSASNIRTSDRHLVGRGAVFSGRVPGQATD